MGTLIGFDAEAATDSRALAAIEAAYDAVRRVESRMHPGRAGSDLAAIQAARIGEPVQIDPWTWEVLVLAQRIARLSAGCFDPCPPCETAGSIGDLDLDLAGIATPRARICLDLGGIAKGFAVNKAIEAMRAGGCDGGMANAGGDLRVFGRPRAVLVRPAQGPPVEIRIDGEALAVSDPGAASRPPEHLGYYLRGCATPKLTRAAAVVAPSAAVADALTKCVLLAPSTLLHDVLAQLRAVSIDI